MLDMKNNIDAVATLAPSARTASANGTSVGIANYDAAMLLIHPGTITDGTHTPALQESSDGSSGWTAVAAADMIGTLAALASNTIQRVGYIGTKPFLRIATTVSGATTGGVYGASIVRGRPKKAAV